MQRKIGGIVEKNIRPNRKGSVHNLADKKFHKKVEVTLQPACLNCIKHKSVKAISGYVFNVPLLKGFSYNLS